MTVLSDTALRAHDINEAAAVAAKEAALADAAATMAANLVTKVAEVDAALQRIAGIEGYRSLRYGNRRASFQPGSTWGTGNGTPDSTHVGPSTPRLVI